MELKTKEDYLKYLEVGRVVRLYSKKPLFKGNGGYVRAVHDDHFEFGLVTNGYEHFGNGSGDPVMETHKVSYDDIENISFTP